MVVDVQEMLIHVRIPSQCLASLIIEKTVCGGRKGKEWLGGQESRAHFRERKELVCLSDRKGRDGGRVVNRWTGEG